MVESGLELEKTFAKPVNGTRSSIGKFPKGKQDYLFRSSILTGNFPVERTKKFPESLKLGKWKNPTVYIFTCFFENVTNEQTSETMLNFRM